MYAPHFVWTLPKMAVAKDGFSSDQSVMMRSFSSRCRTCFGVVVLFLLPGFHSAAQGPAPRVNPEWLTKSVELMRQGKSNEALKVLETLPESERDSRYANVKGSIFTQLRRFGEARTMFTESIKLAGEVVPEAYHPKFNLAEINFVEKQWAASEAGFKELMKEPWRSYRSDGQSSSLPFIYLKVCLCQIRTKRNAEAAATYRELKTIPDEQAARAAEAVLVALDFEQGKTAAAQQRLSTLRKNTSSREVTLYEDSFVELGWLKFIGDTGKNQPPHKLPPVPRKKLDG